jgi:hypothetical protein
MIGVVSGIRAGQPWYRTSIRGRRSDRFTQLPVHTLTTISVYDLYESLLLYRGLVKCTSARLIKFENCTFWPLDRATFDSNAKRNMSAFHET